MLLLFPTGMRRGCFLVNVPRQDLVQGLEPTPLGVSVPKVALRQAIPIQSGRVHHDSIRKAHGFLE